MSKELEDVREGAMQASVHGPDTERVWNVPEKQGVQYCGGNRVRRG